MDDPPYMVLQMTCGIFWLGRLEGIILYHTSLLGTIAYMRGFEGMPVFSASPLPAPRVLNFISSVRLREAFSWSLTLWRQSCYQTIRGQDWKLHDVCKIIYFCFLIWNINPNCEFNLLLMNINWVTKQVLFFFLVMSFFYSSQLPLRLLLFWKVDHLSIEAVSHRCRWVRASLWVFGRGPLCGLI